MFAAWKDLLDAFIAPGVAPPPLPLRLAVAVLLVEVMRANDGLSADEVAVGRKALAEQFAIAESDLSVLLEQAEQESRTAYDYFRFTEPLDHALPHERKVALIEAMWNVAYADEQVDGHENAVIAKVADLLHVSHGEYIAAKMRAKPQA